MVPCVEEYKLPSYKRQFVCKYDLDISGKHIHCLNEQHIRDCIDIRGLGMFKCPWSYRILVTIYDIGIALGYLMNMNVRGLFSPIFSNARWKKTYLPLTP